MRFCLRLGETAEARALLARLPSLEHLPTRQQMEAHLHLGRVAVTQGDIPAYRYHYPRALVLARQINHPEGLAISLSELEIQHNYDGRHMAEITALLERVSDQWVQRRIYLFLGTVSIRHRRYRETCAHWQKVLEISLTLEDVYSVAMMYNNLGDALREAGDFAAVEESFQQAMHLSEVLHYQSLCKNALEGWARLCVLQGDYERALPMAQESAALCRAGSDRMGEVAALACMGHAYAGLGQWSQAENAYSQAAALLPEIPHLALESLAGLAYVCWKGGQVADARKYIERFLASLEQVDIDGFASPVLSYGRVADVLRALGEQAQADALLARQNPADASVHW